MSFNIPLESKDLAFVALLVFGAIIIILGVAVIIRSVKGIKSKSSNILWLIFRLVIGLLLLVFGSLLSLGDVVQYTEPQKSVNNASPQHTYTCLVKGPERLVLSHDPVDFAMARGIDAAIQGEHKAANAAFLWVLNNTNSQDSRHVAAWYNSRCAQLADNSLSQINTTPLPTSTPQIIAPTTNLPKPESAPNGVNSPNAPPTASPIDQAYQANRPATENEADRARRFNNLAIEKIAAYDLIDARNNIQQASTYKSTGTQLDIISKNLTKIQALIDLACGLSKQFHTAECNFKVEDKEVSRYKITDNPQPITPGALIKFKVVSTLIDHKDDKKLTLYIEDIIAGTTNIDGVANHEMEITLPRLDRYKYVLKATYRADGKDCGCSSKSSGTLKISNDEKTSSGIIEVGDDGKLYITGELNAQGEYHDGTVYLVVKP